MRAREGMIPLVVGALSVIFAICSATELCPSAILPPASLSHANAQRRRQAVRQAAGACVCIGLVAWLFCEYLACTFTELAGDFIGTKHFTGAALMAGAFHADIGLGCALVVMVVIAPLMQAAAGLVPPKRRQGSALRTYSDALAMLDVFTMGFLATAVEINDIAVWIFSDDFGNSCSVLDELIGASCIGVSPRLRWFGTFGLCLSLLGSLVLLSCPRVEESAGNSRRSLGW